MNDYLGQKSHKSAEEIVNSREDIIPVTDQKINIRLIHRRLNVEDFLCPIPKETGKVKSVFTSFPTIA